MSTSKKVRLIRLSVSVQDTAEKGDGWREQRKAPWAQGPRLDGCTMYSATDTLESVGVGTAERKRERERPVLTQRITYHLGEERRKLGVSSRLPAFQREETTACP